MDIFKIYQWDNNLTFDYNIIIWEIHSEAHQYMF